MRTVQHSIIIKLLSTIGSPLYKKERELTCRILCVWVGGDGVCMCVWVRVWCVWG